MARFNVARYLDECPALYCNGVLDLRDSDYLGRPIYRCQRCRQWWVSGEDAINLLHCEEPYGWGLSCCGGRNDLLGGTV